MKSLSIQILLLIFIFNLKCLYPQHTDSSNPSFSSTNVLTDTICAKENLDSLYQLNSYENAVILAQQFVDRALLTNDSTKIANSLLILGIMQENKGVNTNAFETLLDAYTIFKSKHNKIGTALTMDHLGTLFRYHGSQKKSLEYHTKAYRLLKQGFHSSGLINVLNNLGIINRQLGNDKKAIEYHKQALNLAIKTGSQNISSIYISIGTYYWYKGVNDSALYYYKSARNIPPNNLLLKERHCAALNNIGNVYRSMHQYDSALYYYNLSIEESRLYQTRNLESVNLKNLGRVYTLIGEYDKAYDFFQRSLNIATEINLKKIILENYNWLGELFEKQQDYKKALVYFKKYADIENVILAEKQLAEINQLERDFSIEQSDKRRVLKLKENSEKNLLIQKRRTSEIIYIALLLFLLSSSLFIFFQYRTKKRSNLQLVKLNEKLEKKVEDRTKSLFEAKQIAEENEIKFKAAFYTSPDSVNINTMDGEYIEINDGFTRLTGYTKDNVIGKRSSEINIWTIPDDRKKLTDALEKHGYIENLESIFKSKDGRLIPALMSAKIITLKNKPHILSVTREISDRKKFEQEIIAAKEKAEESEAKFRKLSANVPDLIFQFTRRPDGSYHVPIASEGIKNVFGCSPEDVFDDFEPIARVIHPKDAARVISDIEYSANHLTYFTCEFRVQIPGKEIQWIFSRSTPEKLGDGSVTWYGFNVNITERKKIEEELIKAKEKAEESDRLKSAFLANMSHEIRTPMNGILGFTNLLQQPDLSGKEQEKYIDIIKKSGDRMLNTVNDIIDISRIEAGLEGLNVSEVNINEQLRYLYSFFLPEAEKKEINLIFKNEDSEKDIICKTDPDKFNSILTNLIKNAIKFTNKGSIELGYNIKDDSGFSELMFYVKDSGIGIPKNRQQAVFDRFVQADIEDVQAKQGSGLGLAISKAYAEMMGGKIWLESEDGKGSIFYFTIKFHNDSKIKPIKKFDDDIIKKDDSLSGKLNILIVEDDESSQQYISLLVDKFAKNIKIVISGLEAIEECHNNNIDLILMDIQLPGMNGYETTQEIRKFNKDVVIIAQTAYALAGDREKAIEAGCNDYISKPIDKKELVSIINKYL